MARERKGQPTGAPEETNENPSAAQLDATPGEAQRGQTLDAHGNSQPEVIPHNPMMNPGHDPSTAKAIPQDQPPTNTGPVTPGVIPHAEGMNPGHDPEKAKAVPLDAPGGKPVPEQTTTQAGRAGTSRVMVNAVRRGPRGETLAPGEYDLDDDEAKEFVRQGVAVYVKPQAEAPESTAR